MPRIRILRESGGYQAGEIVNAPPELCEGWVEAGLAELLEADGSEAAPFEPPDEPEPPEVEAAVEPDSETAVSQRKPGGRRRHS